MGDEGRRFLRYVIPGLVYGVETLLFLILVLPAETVSALSDLSKRDVFSLVATYFLASGGLGYIFGSIHHWFLWRFEEYIFDHRPIVEKLQSANLIALDNETLMRIRSANTCDAREQAQTYSLGIWYRYAVEDHPGKAQIDHLGNQAHGLGTARVASLFALFTALWVSVQYGTLDTALWRCITCGPHNVGCGPMVRYVAMLLIGVGTTVIFHRGYRRVAQFAQETYDMTLEYECTLAPDIARPDLRPKASTPKKGRVGPLRPRRPSRS